jgi:endonuclease-3
MNRKQRAHLVQDVLETYFPTVDVPLHHHDPYTLLIAVLLSAQCTDIRVNQVTPKLFALADTPQKMIQHSVDAIREIIRPCGLSNTKAKAIWQLSKILCEKYNGLTPADWQALELLPGVGHKTASVVMSQAFGIPAFPVDTHIHRCAKRWGLSSGTTVRQTEADLKALYSPESWNKLHIQIILFARQYCRARPHDITQCPICSKLDT